MSERRRLHNDASKKGNDTHGVIVIGISQARQGFHPSLLPLPSHTKPTWLEMHDKPRMH
jgi:hypothetical protein